MAGYTVGPVTVQPGATVTISQALTTTAAGTYSASLLEARALGSLGISLVDLPKVIDNFYND